MALSSFFYSFVVFYILKKFVDQLLEKMGVCVLAKIEEHVAAPIWRRLVYVFFYIIDFGNFRTRRENLEKTRDEVQRLVDAAERNGKVILQDVQEWLTNVDKIIESSRLFDDKHQSNLKLHYRRSGYFKKTVDVDKLIQVGINFDKVSTSAVRFGSRERIFKDIMEALKDDKINVIGIYGMPGVGKTILAKQVMQQAKHKLFDKVLMLVVSQTPDWEKIQHEIANKTLVPKVENKGESQREGQGSTQYKKRILIVLDDIWENVELDEAIGISFGMKQEGWKVVLTSRKKDVYDRMGTDKNFFVEVINEDEAWNLFRKTAGDSIESSDLRPLAVKIAKECGGLPIAIVTIANTIKGKSYSILRDVLSKLKNSTTKRVELFQKVISAIELSYNHVDDDEAKKIFLLCCLFPEDYDIPIQVLMMYGMGLRWFEGVGTVEEARDRVHALVHSLKSSCLLQDGKEEECVKMHDVIRDVAVKIASEDEVGFLVKAGAGSKVFPEEEALNRCTAISLFSDDFHELPGALECPKLKILSLGSFLESWRVGMSGSSSRVPNNFSLRTESLKVLNRIDFSLPPPLMVVRNLENLRTLCLTCCSVKDTLSIIGEELKNLEYLSFRESDIEELPEEIRMLTQLKLLDLTRCKKLKVIPRDVIGGLSQLEGLFMEGSFDEWELERQERKNASLGELKCLSYLITLDIRIPDANLLPEDLVFENLSRFKICIGTSFRRSVQFSHSKILLLQLNVNTALKDGIKELLKKVEHLQLSEMKGLKSVVSDLDREGFQNLRRLHVDECGDVEYIFNASEWSSPVAFPKLEKLSLFGLPKLKEICHGQLPAMFFSELQELRLSDLPELINLWNDPAHHLYFLHNLTVVKVEDCVGLKNLFSHSVAKGLSKLVELEVIRCRRMEEIVRNDKEAASAAAVDDIMFPKLRSLELSNLPKLKNFCSKMDTSTEEALFGKKVLFPALETLHIGYIGLKMEIQHSQLLAETLGFRNLRSINICNCNRLKSLFSPSMASSLVQLKELEISSCEMMESIIAEERKADEYCQERRRSLKLLNLPKLISFMKTFASIFSVQQNLSIKEGNPRDQKVTLPAMEVLKIKGLDNLKAIWHPLQLQAESTCQLKVLEVKKCHKISNVIPSNLLKRLTNLEEVSIEECDSVEIIFEVERLGVEDRCVTLSQLKKFSLSGLPKLFTSKHPNQLHMNDEELKEKPVESNLCITIRPLFDEWVTLPAMEVLKIEGLDNLKAIWHPLQLQAGSSCQLKVLEVKSCHKISNVIPSNLLKRLTNLEEVSIEECDSVEIIFEVEWLGVEDRCGTMTLSQLKKLSLSGLPKLFTSKHPNQQKLQKDDEELKEKPDKSNSCITIRPLFNEWVAFTNLEVLRIINIENLQVIFHNQLPHESFSQLRFLEVKKCPKLSRVASSNLLPRLENLKELVVEECNSMEMIFELEGKGHTAISLFQLEKVELRDLSSLMIFCSGNYNFELPALKTLSLEQCPKMQTFSSGYMSTPKLETGEDYKKAWKGDLNSTVDHLFQEKVAFTNLEVLRIINIENLQVIFHNQLPHESFSQLRFLEVKKCPKLSRVASSNLLPRLENLKELVVEECNSMEMIFELEGKGHTAISLFQLEKVELRDLSSLMIFCSGNYNFELPALKTLSLEQCPKMQTFSSGYMSTPKLETGEDYKKAWKGDLNSTVDHLFQEKVCLPTLEVLKIKGLNNLKGIWHPQILAESFCRLRVLEVESCHKLSNVIPSNLLKRLTNLMEVSVKECDSLQMIFEVEPLAVKDRHGTGTLPQLKKLELFGLPKLFTSEHPVLQNLEMDDEKFEEKLDENNSCIPILPLFDERVAFTNLEDLRIVDIENLQEIFHTQLADESFSQLRFLVVRKCHKLSRVAPPNLLPRLKNLNKLVVEECNSMEKIFELEGKGPAAFSHFQLEHVELRDLPKLMMFCSGSSGFELPSFALVFKCPNMHIHSRTDSIAHQTSVYVEGEEKKWKGDLNSTIHHLFQEKAKLKSDKSSGNEVEEGALGENASAHQGIQHVISEIQEEA